MKTRELYEILKLTGGICRDAGGEGLAKAFDDLALLCDGCESITVAAFTALLEKAAAKTRGQAS